MKIKSYRVEFRSKQNHNITGHLFVDVPELYSVHRWVDKDIRRELHTLVHPTYYDFSMQQLARQGYISRSEEMYYDYVITTIIEV